MRKFMAEKRKKKRSAADLVASSTGGTGSKWTNELNMADRVYLSNVIRHMKQTPVAAVHVVAAKLKEELGLKRSVGTIAKTLKELLNDAKA
jgi:hypothetical protein